MDKLVSPHWPGIGKYVGENIDPTIKECPSLWHLIYKNKADCFHYQKYYRVYDDELEYFNNIKKP